MRNRKPVSADDAGMVTLNQLASYIPASLAKALVKHDLESAANPREAAEENLFESGVRLFQALPYASVLVPVLVARHFGADMVDEAMGRPALAAKNLGAGTVLPMVSWFGPAGVALNAAVNLTWSATDFVQALAWLRLASEGAEKA